MQSPSLSTSVAGFAASEPELSRGPESPADTQRCPLSKRQLQHAFLPASDDLSSEHTAKASHSKSLSLCLSRFCTQSEREGLSPITRRVKLSSVSGLGMPRSRHDMKSILTVGSGTTGGWVAGQCPGIMDLKSTLNASQALPWPF